MANYGAILEPGKQDDSCTFFNDLFFYLFFFRYAYIQWVRENPVTIEITGFFVELLPGFGPGTSSLPTVE